MTSSPDSAFGAIAFPRLGSQAPADRSAEERGYAAGLARARAHAEQQHARRLAGLELAAAAREAAREAEHRAAMAAFAAAIAAVRRTTLPVLESAERELAQGALALAEAIVGVELAGDPERAARVAVDRVLAHPDAPLALRVRVHPDDLAVLDALTARLAPGSRSVFARRAASAPANSDLDADASWHRLPELVADASLTRGDAVAELPDGLIDARISTAIARARRALEERP
ncbi:FliH/SctL family protein [Agromyces soli]